MAIRYAKALLLAVSLIGPNGPIFTLSLPCTDDLLLCWYEVFCISFAEPLVLGLLFEVSVWLLAMLPALLVLLRKLGRCEAIVYS